MWKLMSKEKGQKLSCKVIPKSMRQNPNTKSRRELGEMRILQRHVMVVVVQCMVVSNREKESAQGGGRNVLDESLRQEQLSCNALWVLFDVR